MALKRGIERPRTIPEIFVGRHSCTQNLDEILLPLGISGQSDILAWNANLRHAVRRHRPIGDECRRYRADELYFWHFSSQTNGLLAWWRATFFVC